MNSTKKQSNTKTEWFVRIGIVVLFLGILVSLLVYNIRCASPVSSDTSKNFGDVLWRSLVSGDSGLILILTLVSDILVAAFVKTLKKSKLVIITVIIYFVTVFDNISIECQISSSWVAFGNFIAIVICAIIVLTTSTVDPCNDVLDSASTSCMKLSKYGVFRSEALSKAISDTSNRKIIATQLYEVRTSLVPQTGLQDTARVKFDITHIGDDFVRSGYDINSMSCASYVMDRNIVDCFPIILGLYEKFRESGGDNDKDVLLMYIKEKILTLAIQLSKLKVKNP